MKKSIWILLVMIVLTLFVFGKKVATLDQLVNPAEMASDGERLYITDGATIYIYSTKDYKMIKKFGKEGEGPQEFFLNRAAGNDRVILFFKGDELLVNSTGRLSYFTKTGEFKKEIKIPSTVGQWFKAVGDKFIGRKFTNDEKGLAYHLVVLYNSKFEEIKQFYKHEHGLQLRLLKPFNPLAVDQAEFKVCDNKILVIPGDHSAIIAYDANGDKLFSAEPPDEVRVEYTAEDKKEKKERFKRNSFWNRFYSAKPELFKFPEYWPKIRWYFPDGTQKKLYIQTHKVKEDENGSKLKYLVYDFKGKLLKQVWLPFTSASLHLFDSGKFYRLIESEDGEEHQLHVVELK
ncbi:MAG: hypothetical protein GY757_19430 [bacterium]|nr:hypothetical protein [bacterium]